ncbi:DNA-binding response regulator [Rubrivivax gelatinosus]|nr:DNA-binding response regulator [Rubrivivax gelatinosus]
MIRLLIADDHPVVREGYRRLLEQAGGIEVVAEAGDADTADAAWAVFAPELLVTDLAMPGGGLELIRRVRLRSPAAAVLVFSMHDGEAMVRRALAAGARGYLSKSAAPELLVDAVRALHAGRSWLDPGLPPGWLRRDPLSEGERLSSLSAREFEVFRLLAAGCSAADCALALGLSAKTVSNHQTVIKDKLGVATSAALVHLAWRHGVISPAGA